MSSRPAPRSILSVRRRFSHPTSLLAVYYFGLIALLYLPIENCCNL